MTESILKNWQHGFLTSWNNNKKSTTTSTTDTVSEDSMFFGKSRFDTDGSITKDAICFDV